MKWVLIALIVVGGVVLTEKSAEAGGQCFVQQQRFVAAPVVVQQRFVRQPVFVQRQRFVRQPVFVQRQRFVQPVFVRQPGFNFSFGRFGGRSFRSFSFGF